MNARNTDLSKLATAATPVVPAPAEGPARRRRPLRYAMMLALPLALAGTGGYVWLTSGRYESTENASLQLPRVSISAEVEGRVVEVDLRDSAPVKAGDLLFRVDPEPYRIALEEADAALAAARLDVEQLKAAFASAEANARFADENLSFYKSDFDRQQALNVKGFVAVSVRDAAERLLHNAEESKAAAVQAVESARAALGGDPDAPVDAHPAVRAAQAARDRAAYDLERTSVRAPSGGVIAEAGSFRVGQYVGEGAPLFVLVETGDVWVEANFKETQLTNMAPGQAATITFDTYPGREFAARVEAIGAGTGAEFSLLPAQNATGNWVKVTQRVPVRLALDAADADAVGVTGMSAKVTVDTGKQRALPGLFAHAATQP